jgi:hypothetical protein
MSDVENINVASLITYQVEADGSAVQMNVLVADGTQVGISLPVECLQMLALALPKMVEQALKALHQDPAIRLVYSVDTWAVERDSQGNEVILTFTTPDKFAVSFGVEEADIMRIAETFVDHEVEAYPLGLRIQ